MAVLDPASLHEQVGTVQAAAVNMTGLRRHSDHLDPTGAEGGGEGRLALAISMLDNDVDDEMSLPLHRVDDDEGLRPLHVALSDASSASAVLQGLLARLCPDGLDEDDEDDEDDDDDDDDEEQEEEEDTGCDDAQSPPLHQYHHPPVVSSSSAQLEVLQYLFECWPRQEEEEEEAQPSNNDNVDDDDDDDNDEARASSRDAALSDESIADVQGAAADQLRGGRTRWNTDWASRVEAGSLVCRRRTFGTGR
jgi:hypothetical protein